MKPIGELPNIGDRVVISKDALLQALEQCRVKVRAKGGTMGKAFYNNHDELGEYISVEIDKQNSVEFKEALDNRNLEYDCDLSGGFMDFYSIKLEGSK